MQKRILVPLDGSALADRVLDLAKPLVVAGDHELVLLTVVAESPDPAEVVRARQAAHDHLAALGDALVARGATTSKVVLIGDAAERIVEHAAGIGAELVVMATHGRSGLSRFARGSVAEAVLRRCTVPLLLANPRALGAKTSPDGGLRFARILVPLDGSDVALDLLPLVEETAKRHGAQVLLLKSDETSTTSPALLRSAECIAAELEPVRQRLVAQGIDTRVLAAIGAAAAEIIDAAEREQVDLVAMSTHGRSGVTRWLFGSVAELVLRHCARPLLVRRVHQGSEGVRPRRSAAAGREPLSAKALLGADVKDLTLSKLGEVEDLVMDARTGRITYAVLRFGGFLGLAERLFPVPWSRLHWRAGDRSLVLQHHGKRREELAHAPHVHRREERDHTWIHALAPAVHTFYPGPQL